MVQKVKARARRTGRGFRIYGNVACRSAGQGVYVRVQESSRATGARRAWMFLDGDCVDHLGNHQNPSPELTPSQARRIAKALLAFAVGE